MMNQADFAYRIALAERNLEMCLLNVESARELLRALSEATGVHEIADLAAHTEVFEPRTNGRQNGRQRQIAAPKPAPPKKATSEPPKKLREPKRVEMVDNKSVNIYLLEKYLETIDGYQSFTKDDVTEFAKGYGYKLDSGRIGGTLTYLNTKKKLVEATGKQGITAVYRKRAAH